MFLGGLAVLDRDAAAVETESETAEAPPAAKAPEDPNRLSRQGLVVEFKAGPILGSFEEDRELFERDYANVAFRIIDATSGEPVQGLNPGAWIDLAKTAKGETSQALGCKDRVGLYLRGSTGVRPLIDLNSYYILAMNQDATITVVDPNVLIAGIGDMFFTQVMLPRPGGDWAQNREQTRLYVSMPRADALAVVDTEAFRLIKQIKTGKEPLRVALQKDEKYVWVGDDAKGKEGGGVTVIDTETLSVAAEIETGKGHHEIVFSGDDRYALVTNRRDGTVSVIDVQKLEKIKDLALGTQPIGLAYSSLSQAFYVADGERGVISVLDGTSHEVIARIRVEPGLGPMRVTQDGRWLLATNSAADFVHVIDTSSNTVAHDVPIKGKPYKVSLTRAFAYVRALESERISMINLAELGKAQMPPVVTIPIGAEPPAKAQQLSIADSIVEAAGEAGMIAVSPADDTLYFYMEGMNAPMGNFRSHGHSPRAVTVTDRALVEKRPGTYSAQVQIPLAGTYDVAFVLDSPPILHCFSVAALPNPALQRDREPLAVEYLIEDRNLPAGETFRLRFRLTDPATEQPSSGLQDVRVLFYRAPGHDRTEVPAEEVEEGIYEAAMSIRRAGAYYVYVSSGSMNVPYGKLPYLTLRALKDGQAPGHTKGARDTRG
jgi:YVTN family beta-propeller protein